MRNPFRQRSGSWCTFRREFFLVVLVLLTLVGVLRRSQQWTHHDSPVLPIRLSHFPPSSAELKVLNSQLKEPDDVLKWAHATFGKSLAQVTSFGPSGLVILHKLHSLGYLMSTPVISIDTLHLFPESSAFWKDIQNYFTGEMDLQIYGPQDYSDRESFDASQGVDLYRTNPDLYGYLTKVEPTLRALQDLKISAWMTGRRRSQGGERKDLKVIEVDPTDPNRLKINPLANWSYQQVWKYIHNNKIPYNPLYDQGYKSIGDTMTTVKVDSKAAERSGRFVGMTKTECGMHAHKAKIQRMKKEAQDANREFIMPTLPCDDCLDVTTETFDAVVLNKSGDDLLLEFYSPMCGGCQAFSPTYKWFASILKPVPGIQVARFDITESDIPDSGVKAGLTVEVTPALFLVLRNPFRVIPYHNDDSHDKYAILEWLEQQAPQYYKQMDVTLT